MKIDTDVLIIGGGVSGTMAAIAAGRRGVKTTLIERGGCLGGMWTAGLVGMTLDSDYKGGLLSDFLVEVRRELKNDSATLFEVQKYILEKWCQESGVNIYLHSQVYGVKKEGRDIKSVQVISKSGTIDFGAKIIIDATGDGDVAAMSGCEFEFGRASDGRAQPMSMIALITGLDERAKEYISYPNQPFWGARNRLKGILDTIERIKE